MKKLAYFLLTYVVLTDASELHHIATFFDLPAPRAGVGALGLLRMLVAFIDPLERRASCVSVWGTLVLWWACFRLFIRPSLLKCWRYEIALLVCHKSWRRRTTCENAKICFLLAGRLLNRAKWNLRRDGFYCSIMLGQELIRTKLPLFTFHISRQTCL